MLMHNHYFTQTKFWSNAVNANPGETLVFCARNLNDQQKEISNCAALSELFLQLSF